MYVDASACDHAPPEDLCARLIGYRPEDDAVTGATGSTWTGR